jgi:hypothetical protein
MFSYSRSLNRYATKPQQSYRMFFSMARLSSGSSFSLAAPRRCFPLLLFFGTRTDEGEAPTEEDGTNDGVDEAAAAGAGERDSTAEAAVVAVEEETEAEAEVETSAETEIETEAAVEGAGEAAKVVGVMVRLSRFLHFVILISVTAASKQRNKGMRRVEIFFFFS